MINIEQRLLININWRIFYFCLLLIYVIKCTKQQMQYVVSTSIFYVLYESTLSVDIIITEMLPYECLKGAPTTCLLPRPTLRHRPHHTTARTRLQGLRYIDLFYGSVFITSYFTFWKILLFLSSRSEVTELKFNR